MTVEFQWFFGLFAILGLSILTGVIANQNRRINDLTTALEVVRRDYVRRDDLNGSLAVIHQDMGEMKGDIKEVSGMMVKLLMAYGKLPP